MKLIRFGEAGAESPGIHIQGRNLDVSELISDYDEAFFAGQGLEKLAAAIQEDVQIFPEVSAGVRLGSPIARPSKIVCIGLNYEDHALETHAAIPAEPVVFLKSTTALSGPNDAIMLPRNSVKTDWEVELAVVVGKKASYVDELEAMDYVAGYCLHNDVSEREYQLERNGTWDKGKGCDTFAPMGPWMVTKDEIADPNNLRLWLTVNDQIRQDGSTRNFIFKVAFLVSYVSQFMTLLPGDVISTGTPAGVGLGMKPPVYLKPGDIVELGIEGLGMSRQTVIEFSRNR